MTELWTEREFENGPSGLSRRSVDRIGEESPRMPCINSILLPVLLVLVRQSSSDFFLVVKRAQVTSKNVLD